MCSRYLQEGQLFLPSKFCLSASYCFDKDRKERMASVEVRAVLMFN